MRKVIFDFFGEFFSIKTFLTLNVNEYFSFNQLQSNKEDNGCHLVLTLDTL